MRHFLSIQDCTRNELLHLLRLSRELKAVYKTHGRDTCLAGKVLAMLFEKTSLRTRISFEVAMADLGGHAIYLKPEDIGIIGQREPAKDMARVLSRYVDGLMARTFAHETIVELARYASVPVVNALSDWSHPCQAMADMLTIQEHCGRLDGLTLTYIGDGNNVARSLALACGKLGLAFVIASPPGYELDEASLATANNDAGSARQVTDPAEAVVEADIIYTDTWVSMGQEEEKQQRIRDFQGYQVNAELLAKAPSRVRVMHCLPAYRGMEITDEMAELDRSIIFDQAENRLHFQRALLKELMS